MFLLRGKSDYIRLKLRKDQNWVIYLNLINQHIQRKYRNILRFFFLNFFRALLKCGIHWNKFLLHQVLLITHRQAILCLACRAALEIEMRTMRTWQLQRIKILSNMQMLHKVRKLKEGKNRIWNTLIQWAKCYLALTIFVVY